MLNFNKVYDDWDWLKSKPYDWIPDCCKNCPNHPNNGGSGICNCVLPYFSDSGNPGNITWTDNTTISNCKGDNTHYD